VPPAAGTTGDGVGEAEWFARRVAGDGDPESLGSGMAGEPVLDEVLGARVVLGVGRLVEYLGPDLAERGRLREGRLGPGDLDEVAQSFSSPRFSP